MCAWNIYSAALVGCGRIGYSLGLDKRREQPASHTMALNANPCISLIAGCDTNVARLNEWKEANKRSLTYSDSANLYARQTPDIIVIAVNEEFHLSEALKAIKNKPKLVILEKPVALNLNEALKIFEASKECNVPVLVNHERRFAEDYKLAKKYMEKIGELQSIRAELNSSMCVYNPEEEKTGAYSLLHDGTHLVDILLYFLEKEEASSLKEVPAVTKKALSGGLLRRVIQEPSEEEKTFVNELLNSPLITSFSKDEDGKVRNLSVHYSNSICSDITMCINGKSKFFGFEITITGTLGRICIGNGYLKFYKREKSELYSGFYSLASDNSVHIPRKTLYFSNMVKNAIDFLEGRKPLVSSLQNGINALAVLEEILCKLKQKL